MILAASYFFYGWWSYKFLGLLALSTLLDYLYGFGVASKNNKKSKLFLWLSILNNLGILAIFKYYNFFALEFQKVLELFGLHSNPTLLSIALPVGISFYTFHGMSYVFDIYRGIQKPIKNLVDYSVFVSFFPLLVAGPIERASHLLPQVQTARKFDYSQAVDGCKLIIWGFFKKVVIADTLALTVDYTFGNYQHLNAFSLIIGAIAFSIQIYCDFSGYSDMALGIAKLFGFELLSNFRFPYFSRDIAEFWRRWHISLSTWFRDYLYIPLGGSKSGKRKAVVNTFIIFIVSGFWHGASWNFIIWGGIHALCFMPLLLTNKNRKHTINVVAYNSKWPNPKELLQMINTFAIVTISWVFFRANDLQTATGYLRRIITSTLNEPSQYLHLPGGKTAILYAIPFIIFDWTLRRNERQLHFNKFWLILLAILGLFYFFLHLGESINFIYFQF